MRWAEHFREVTEPPIVDANTQEDLDASTDVPSMEEVKPIYNNGFDNMNNEMCKVTPELTTSILEPIFTANWKEDKTITKGNQGFTVRLQNYIPSKTIVSRTTNALDGMPWMER